MIGDRVSLIIPAYNVEKYIEKCILSILNQTHKNLEVIAVDDGSVDKTGKILDAISKIDNRVLVIHKENAGVSVARNVGLEICKGDYVVFVDGDDYLDPDYVTYMLSLVKQTNAEFCLSKCCHTKKGERQSKSEIVKKYCPAEATALLLSPEVIVGCWNKIFERSFLEKNKLRFSTSLFYGEGLSFITTAAQLSNGVGVGNRRVYYYRRNNEASATSKFSIDKLYNGEKALKIIADQLIVNNQKVKTMLNLHMCLFYLGAISKIKVNGVEKEYKETCKKWLSYIRKNTFKLLPSKNVSVYRKLMLIMACISPSVLAKLDVLRRKIIEANSVNE